MSALLGGRPYRLFHTDARDLLWDMEDNSIDAIVTDPPYALVSVVKRFGKAGAKAAKEGADGRYTRQGAGFMGEKWDTGEVAFAETFWRECERVLKPGGHVLAMGGTRTYHRLACAIEDGGFDIRDQLAWVYGTGFPKSHDEGEGRGTALKPAWEPICLARKNLSEKTIALNLAKWGTGALWIDRSRVPGNVEEMKGRSGTAVEGNQILGAGIHNAGGGVWEPAGGGRWPANIITDGSPEVLGAFPSTGPSRVGNRGLDTSIQGGNFAAGKEARPWVDKIAGHNDAGGSTARFFYAAKASKTDREEGTSHLPVPEGHKRTNFHPTVKPTGLMGWQIGLVTPPGGVVFDPFMGSGSTGKAAIRGGFQFIGCDFDPRYVEISRARLDFEAEKRAEAEQNDY